jgi:predicted DNA-binding transcriptional regulator AlpA
MTKTKPASEGSAQSLPAALTTAEAAQYLGLSPKTLGNLRTIGGGPRYIKYSHRAVRYQKADLDAWIDSRRVGSTSERQAA